MMHSIKDNSLFVGVLPASFPGLSGLIPRQFAIHFEISVARKPGAPPLRITGSQRKRGCMENPASLTSSRIPPFSSPSIGHCFFPHMGCGHWWKKALSSAVINHIARMGLVPGTDVSLLNILNFIDPLLAA